MSKRYYWKMNGRLYEVSKGQYFEYRKEQDRHNYLKKNEQEAVILSLDAIGAEGKNGEVFIANERVNVEEEIVHKLMLEKLKGAISKLSTEELLLIDALFSQLKSEREAALLLGISQKAKNGSLRKSQFGFGRSAKFVSDADGLL